MEKTAIQLMIKWVIANPDVTHAERISKAMELRDAEENRLRERVRELEEGLNRLVYGHRFTIQFDGKESQSKYNDALRQAKSLLTKPDSTWGGEKGICMEDGCKRPATKDYNGHGHYVCDLCYDSLSREFDREYS